MIRHFFTIQFLSFVAVGATAALLHWLARILLSFWLPFGYAVTFSYIVGMTVAFLLNSYFVFNKSQKAKKQQVVDFVLVNLAFFPIVWGLSIYLNNYLNSMGLHNHSKEISHGLAVCFPTLATFLIYKFFAFKET